METTRTRQGARVLGTFIDALTWEQALALVGKWAQSRQSRYLCAANVHVVVTASTLAALRNAVNHADMAVPDGAPVALALRLLGFPGQRRLAGPDLMWNYCEMAAAAGQRVFLYGSTPETLDKLQEHLRAGIPGLQIVEAYSPPFRELTEAEDQAVVERINASGAHAVLVGLGCPKQEIWMAQHRGRVNALMLGVGAAFDFHAGVKSRAPLWIQNLGLEWLHRLFSEPRRLARRYFVTNTVFLVKMTWQLLQNRR